jgi:addiction module HigA family antidote
MRMARPAHPGQFIRMEVFEPLDLSVTKAAEALGVTRPALSALLNGRAALSSDMALRIEKAFGPRMDTLLRMQTAHEIAEAREREGDIKVKRYVAKPHPTPEMLLQEAPVRKRGTTQPVVARLDRGRGRPSIGTPQGLAKATGPRLIWIRLASAHPLPQPRVQPGPGRRLYYDRPPLLVPDKQLAAA